MKKVAYVSLIVALAACLNFVLAGEEDSPAKKLFGKLFSQSRVEARNAELKLLSDSSPETLKAVQKEIEVGCRGGDYDKVQRLAEIKRKLLSKHGITAETLKAKKKQAKAFVEGKPAKGDKLSEPRLVGKKLPAKVKKEKGGAR